MKGNAIVRIICYSLIAVILTGVLCLGIRAENWNLAFHLGGNSGEPIQGELQVDAAKIENIEIEWVAGDVKLSAATDGSQQICVTETGASKEEHRAVWEIQGKTLVIRFCKGSIGFGSSMPSKDLAITVPAGWVCNNLDIESVSGSVDVRCALNSLECESVSGSCSIYPTNIPKQLNLESVSGSLILGIPEDVGFRVDLDSVSGKIRSDFGTTFQDGQQVYGDGSCQIDAETVSGDIQILRTNG